MSSVGAWIHLGDDSDDESDDDKTGVGKEIGACDQPAVKKQKIAASTRRPIHAVYTTKEIEAEIGSHGSIKVCECRYKNQLGGCLAEYFKRHDDGSLDIQALCAFVIAKRETCRVKSKEDVALFAASVYHDCIDAQDKKRNSGVSSSSSSQTSGIHASRMKIRTPRV